MKQERPYRLFCNVAMTDALEGMWLEEKVTPSRPGRVFFWTCMQINCVRRCCVSVQALVENSRSDEKEKNKRKGVCETMISTTTRKKDTEKNHDAIMQSVHFAGLSVHLCRHFLLFLVAWITKLKCGK